MSIYTYTYILLRLFSIIGYYNVWCRSGGSVAQRQKGDTPRPRSGAAARRNYPTSKVRSSSQEELPHVQGQKQRLRFAGAAMKRSFMSKVRKTQARRQALREGVRGQTDWNHNHRRLANLITRTTALSNSMKLSHAVWGHQRRTAHGGEFWQNVVHWRREWQTTVFLPWEPHEQCEKAKRQDTERWAPRSVGDQCATGDQWRSNSRKNAGMSIKITKKSRKRGKKNNKKDGSNRKSMIKRYI